MTSRFFIVIALLLTGAAPSYSQLPEAMRAGLREAQIPEDAALVVFKEGIGFPVVQVPSKTWLLPVADTLIRWRKPFLHYRLTGRIGPQA